MFQNKNKIKANATNYYFYLQTTNPIQGIGNIKKYTLHININVLYYHIIYKLPFFLRRC
jgi:hypothetical protein